MIYHVTFPYEDTPACGKLNPGDVLIKFEEAMEGERHFNCVECHKVLAEDDDEK